MISVVKSRSTHSGKLERWLGKEATENLSQAVRGWYGPPIAVAGVPGAVWACGDGDFRGRIGAGQFLSAVDFAVMRLKRAWRDAARRQFITLNTGFASLSDLISEATAGKRQDLWYNKTGTTGVVGATNTLWYVGTQPAVGANGGAAPGGTAMTSATTGALFFNNPTSPDTTHFISANPTSSVAAHTLLLFDRLFSVTKTMNSTATEAVTGVPTRYQNTVANSQDSAEGNFLMIETRVALAATGHNWTVCTYTDQGGATGATLPSVTGNASNIVNRLDQQLTQWWCPLATGDTGIKNLTQMQCSALVATGNVDFTIGHNLAFMPCPVANLACTVDGINTAFNFVRIFDNACLALLEIVKSATTASSYAGGITICAG